MNCCESGSHEPKQNNNLSPVEKSKQRIGTNQIVSWVLVLVLISGLIYLLL